MRVYRYTVYIIHQHRVYSLPSSPSEYSSMLVFLLVFKLVGRDGIGSSTCETFQALMWILKLQISPITLLGRAGRAFVKFVGQKLLQTNTPEGWAGGWLLKCQQVYICIGSSREQNLYLTRNTNLKRPFSYIAAMCANSPKSAKGLKRSKEQGQTERLKHKRVKFESMSTQQESLILDSHTLPDLKASIKSIPVNAAVWAMTPATPG